MPQSRRLLLILSGMILCAIGSVILLMQSPAGGRIPPLFWLLAAIEALGALSLVSKRLRRSVVVASLAMIAAAAMFRVYGSIVAQEKHAEHVRNFPVAERANVPQVAVGRLAPDIAASDLSGQPMTLREYRGKVVLLVFWYSACGPCMGDVPHEKALVERFAGRPFALVGVNTDESTERALAAVEQHSIPWKSFRDPSPGGPIATQWDIQYWPTVYLIDDAGVILHKDLRKNELDAPLEQMIAVAEARKRDKENQPSRRTL